MFATTPYRDLLFYSTVASQEGFAGTADFYFFGSVARLLLTVALFPVVAGLTLYGIGWATRLSIFPRFDRFTIVWGSFASVVASLVILSELTYLFYSVIHPHHWPTALISLAYIGFVYLWWCCSIAHGTEVGAASDNP